MEWQTIIYLIGAALMAWLAFRIIKNNPSVFTKENLGKSVYTLGLLALLIIVIIAFAVLILRS